MCAGVAFSQLIKMAAEDNERSRDIKELFEDTPVESGPIRGDLDVYVARGIIAVLRHRY